MKSKLVILFVFIILCLSFCACKSEIQSKGQTIPTQYPKSSEKAKELEITQSAESKQNIENSEEEVFFGELIITKNIASNKVSTYSKEDIEEMIGKSIVYSKSLAIFDGIELKNPYYKKEILTKKENDKYSYVKFEDIGIESDSIDRVEIYTDKKNKSAWLLPGRIFWIKDNDTLILIDDGEFFELNRKK